MKACGIVIGMLELYANKSIDIVSNFNIKTDSDLKD